LNPENAIELGTWDGHDAGAAVCVGGRLVAAMSEERLTRVKKQAGWPRRSIDAVMALAGVGPRDIAKVGLAGTTGRLPARLLARRFEARPPQQEDPLAWPARLYAAYQNGPAGIAALAAVERVGSLRIARRRLAEIGIKAPVHLVDHHRAHALGGVAAVAGIPEVHERRGEQALIVTMDGYGDKISTAAWRSSRGRLELLQADGAASSVALLYGALTRLLGFSPGEEGKVTGLAGACDVPDAAQLDIDLHAFIEQAGGRIHVRRRHAIAAMRKALRSGIPPEHLAAALQNALDRAVVGFIHHHAAATGLRDVAVAGGLFANVVVNGRLAAMCGDGKPLRSFTVFGAMGDQGLCAGAAWHVGWPARPVVGDLRIGVPAGSIGGAASRSGGEQASAAAVVERLEAGQLVGVCRGRLEFGPRALGNRSILFDPRRNDLAATLGRRLKRPSIMPFAPILRAADWARLFDQPYATVARSTAAMTLALPLRSDAPAIPAASHVDGTARPQTIDRATDPWLHDVLDLWHQRTGCPALVNTSLNRHREPICATASDALAAAEATGLDAIVIGATLFDLRSR